MRLRLVRPMVKKGSSIPSFVKRIPKDIRVRLVGKTLRIPLGDDIVSFTVTESTQSIRFSLKSADPATIRSRQALATAYVEDYFRAAAAAESAELSHLQISALRGEFYRPWASGPDNTRTLTSDPLSGATGMAPDEEDEFEQEVMAGIARRMEEHGHPGIDDGEDADERRRDTSAQLGKVADNLASRHGIPEVTARSRDRLAHGLAKDLAAALRTTARIYSGDYSPDPKAAGQPAWPEPERRRENGTGGSSKVSLTGLVNSWWVEAEAAGKSISTYESYRSTFVRLSLWLEHDDALRVTPQDIVGFKDHRLTDINPKTKKPVSAKTVKATDLTAFNSVFEWAVSNLKIPSNPAKGVNLKLGKKTKLRDRDFTDGEAEAILKGANALAGKAGRSQTKLMQRWVPWLCAYSGCRVGELVQLRKEDFRQEGDTWVMTVSPEAGTVKGKEFREIPLHSHLIEMGFLDFLNAAKDDYLFMTIKEGSTVRGVWRSKKNRLTEFVREFVTDPNVAPNHGWRHTFKTKGREVGIEAQTLDAICGHSPRSVGESYGKVSLKTKMDAMKVFPRFE